MQMQSQATAAAARAALFTLAVQNARAALPQRSFCSCSSHNCSTQAQLQQRRPQHPLLRHMSITSKQQHAQQQNNNATKYSSQKPSKSQVAAVTAAKQATAAAAAAAATARNSTRNVQPQRPAHNNTDKTTTTTAVTPRTLQQQLAAKLKELQSQAEIDGESVDDDDAVFRESISNNTNSSSNSTDSEAVMTDSAARLQLLGELESVVNDVDEDDEDRASEAAAMAAIAREDVEKSFLLNSSYVAAALAEEEKLLYDSEQREALEQQQQQQQDYEEPEVLYDAAWVPDFDVSDFDHSGAVDGVQWHMIDSDDVQRSLHVAILGTPNSGKSILVNRLISSKVTAVSPKRNTTRHSIIGILTENDTQIVLYDTPGVNSSSNSKLYQRELATTAWATLPLTDMVLLMVDAAKRIGPAELEVIERAKQYVANTSSSSGHELQLVLVLNKVDLVVPKTQLLPLTERLIALAPFREVFMISALSGDGVADVTDFLFANAGIRAWEHGSNTVTDLTDSERVSEIIKEKIYQRLHKEIPYQIQQTTTSIQRFNSVDMTQRISNSRGSGNSSSKRDAPVTLAVRIDQQLIVELDQHKPIVIGRDGAVIKWIIDAAVIDLQQLFKCKVHLFVRVVSKEKADSALGFTSSHNSDAVDGGTSTSSSDGSDADSSNTGQMSDAEMDELGLNRANRE